jgi:hypothetical protein
MKEVLSAVVQSGIPFLVIGGQGLSVHGVQRDTVDLDCLISVEEGSKITEYLLRHGFEEIAHFESFTRFRHRSLVYPYLDIMAVDRATWTKLSAGSQPGPLFGYPVRVPSVLHYVALKLHAIRQNPERVDKDRLDIVSLIEANPEAASASELEALCSRYAPPGFWDTLRTRLKL